MQERVTIHIAEPCHEAWSEMTPKGLGRHCSSCEKTVTDFTQMSDAQVIAVLKSGQSSSCGRFHSRQLDRVLTLPAPVEEGPRLLPWLAALFLTGSAGTLLSQESTDSLNRRIELQDSSQVSLIDSLMPQSDSLKRLRFFGKVMDNYSQEALQGVEIRLLGSKLTTTSNEDGSFYLEIPGDTNQVKFKFRIKVNDLSFYRTFNLKDLELKQEIEVKTSSTKCTQTLRFTEIYGNIQEIYHPPTDAITAKIKAKFNDPDVPHIPEIIPNEAKNNIQRTGSKWWFAGFIQAVLPSRKRRKGK